MGGTMGDGRTVTERRSDRDLVVTRTFDAPVRLVYQAWTQPELFQLWWAPKSSPVPMIACEMDVRTGGGYSVSFGHDRVSAMTFFGKYVEVVPNERIVWTNEENGAVTVTTVTFEDDDGKTQLTMHDRYPSKDALDATIAGQTEASMDDPTSEQFRQLDDLLVTLVAKG